jgi:hypothetical protein
MGYDIQDAYDEYPVVFTGTVESIDEVKIKESGWFNYSIMKEVVLVVDHNFKGMSGERIRVTTRMDSPACGYPFLKDIRYAVFAFPGESGLHVTSCSPTIHTEKREEYYESERLKVTEFLNEQHGT